MKILLTNDEHNYKYQGCFCTLSFQHDSSKNVDENDEQNKSKFLTYISMILFHYDSLEN